MFGDFGVIFRFVWGPKPCKTEFSCAAFDPQADVSYGWIRTHFTIDFRFGGFYENKKRHVPHKLTQIDTN